jgi:hypothetical protein
MEVPSEPGQMSDTPEVLKEYLLAEHQYLREAFWRNEESGERRLQFFIGLVTAVFGALGFLATTDKGWFSDRPDRISAVAGGGLVFLLLVGWMTLGRMNKRDRVSDEYKASLDEIRNCFLRPAGKACPSLPEPLRAGWPFGGDSEVRVGWLAKLVMTINALIAGALAIDLAYLGSGKLTAGLWAAPLAAAIVGLIQWRWSAKSWPMVTGSAGGRHRPT